ncbi:hypothetical protein D6D13_10553 [Aureobasidium pullulans]|uniref:Uncharacterized protein n=1 Tax=Aureobasidium pullulans TaxID=5580 RepID=A0A4S9BXE8_AURPU|nr:hypothetical protein D6D13_10553 [Aureobasidium pullulans]
MRTRSASADSFIETEADKLALDHILAFAEEFEEIMNVCIVPEGLERALRSLLKKRLGIVNWKGDIEEEEDEGQHLEQIDEYQTEEEKEEEDQKKHDIASPTTEFMADSVSPSPTSQSNTSSDSSGSPEQDPRINQLIDQLLDQLLASPSATPPYTKVTPQRLLDIMFGLTDIEGGAKVLEYFHRGVPAAIAQGLPSFRVEDFGCSFYSQRVFMSWGYVDVPLVYIEEEEEYEDEHENQHEDESEEISGEETGGDVGAEMSGSPLMATQQEDSSEQDESESEVEEEEEETSGSPLMNIQEEGSPELGQSDNESEVEEGEIIEL